MKKSCLLLAATFLLTVSLMAQEYEKAIVGNWRADPGSLNNLTKIFLTPTNEKNKESLSKLTPENITSMTSFYQNMMRGRVFEFTKEGTIKRNGTYEESMPYTWEIKEENGKKYLVRVAVSTDGDELVTKDLIIDINNDKMVLIDQFTKLKVEYLRVKES